MQTTHVTPEPPPARRFEIPSGHGARITVHEHPAVAPQGLVVILGAMATPARFYAPLAEHLAWRGLTTVRFDYRGVGDSRRGSLRGEEAGVLDWTVRDVDAAIAFARERHPSLPLAVLGHSLGGQAIGLARQPRDARAVVLVASQSGWVGHWPGAARVRMEMLWRVVVPGMTGAFGYLPGWSGIGEDVPKRVAREWAEWCTTKGYVTGVRPKSELAYDRITAPVLAWSFTDDDYAPEGSTDELLSWLASARVQHRRRRPEQLARDHVGHFGFFRRNVGTPMWDETADWLLATLEEEPTAAS